AQSWDRRAGGSHRRFAAAGRRCGIQCGRADSGEGGGRRAPECREIIHYQRGDQRFVLIDTAGIRPRGKVDNSVEVFSVMRSESSIRRADLCCLVIDATAGVTAQDKKIAGLIQAARKPCIIAVNKWDLIKERTTGEDGIQEVLEEISSELFFLGYAPKLLVSA